MGSSPDAYLLFGICYPDNKEGKFPWTTDPEYGKYGFEDWCTVRLGPEVASQIKMGHWGWNEEPEWFIAVASTVIHNSWEYPRVVPAHWMSGDTEAYIKILKSFYEKAGLPWPEDPARVGWWLLAGYG